MQRARRLVAVASVALAGSLLLSGCRSSPAVAAYVGDTRITNASLDNMIDTIEEDVKKTLGADALKGEQIGVLRQQLLGALLFVEVAKRYAKEKSYPEPTFDYAGKSQKSGNLPVTDPFVRATAEAEAYKQLLVSKVAPSKPTEADVREIYRRLVTMKIVESGKYDEVKPLILQIPEVAQGIAVRNELIAAAARYDTAVNPSFGRVDGFAITELELQSGGNPFPAVVFPLSASLASPAVVTVS
jgi:hypothetical protein